MKRPTSQGRLTGRGIGLLSVAVLLAGILWPGAASADSSPSTGPKNAITDVPGVEVGQVTDKSAATGTTDLIFPDGALVGANPSGGSPGTRDTTLYMDGKQTLFYTPSNGIILNGGSIFGLQAACGLVNFLQQHGMGQHLFGTKYIVPQVPGAIIFDLARGSDYNRAQQDVIPDTCSWGYKAAAAASTGKVQQGSVGAGTGAQSGGIKGGVGTASTSLGNGIYVGALVVVNSGGKTFNVDDKCELYTAYLSQDNEFGGLRTPPNGCAGQQSSILASSSSARKSNIDTNTTIGVIATNAPLDAAEAVELADLGGDGDARSIRPSNMGGNGDIEYAVSTASSHAGVDTTTFANIAAVAADAYSRAIDHAIVSATPVPNTASTYCELFSGACGHGTHARTNSTAAFTSALSTSPGNHGAVPGSPGSLSIGFAVLAGAAFSALLAGFIYRKRRGRTTVQ